MKVTVRLFAHMAAQAKTSTLALEVPVGSPPAAIEVLLKSRFPEMGWTPGTLIAVNHHYATPTQVLQENDEVAVIPPVSGGRGGERRGGGRRPLI